MLGNSVPGTIVRSAKWDLEVNDERFSLPFFRAVRNENSEQGKKLQKEVTLEDVRCKDHQCSEAACRLSSPKVQEIMKSVERVIIPLSPEKYMYSEDNLEPVVGTIKASIQLSV